MHDNVVQRESTFTALAAIDARAKGLSLLEPIGPAEQCGQGVFEVIGGGGREVPDPTYVDTEQWHVPNGSHRASGAQQGAIPAHRHQRVDRLARIDQIEQLTGFGQIGFQRGFADHLPSGRRGGRCQPAKDPA